MSDLDVERLSENDRLIIWNHLRETISHHREFPTADWSMPSEMTDKLEENYKRFTPEDIITRNLYLFTSSGVKLLNPTPYIKDDSSRHWEDNRKIRVELRIKAVETLYEFGGIKILLEFAQKVDEPASVGFTLGETNLIEKSENEFLLSYLADENEAIAYFTRGYVNAKFNKNGWEWTKEKLSSKSVKKWSAAQKAEFLICFPFKEETWNIVDLYGNKTKKLYWNKVNGFPELEDAERATREFLAHNRPQATVEFLSYLERMDKPAVPANLIVEILTKLVSVKNNDGINLHNAGYNMRWSNKSGEKTLY